MNNHESTFDEKSSHTSTDRKGIKLNFSEDNPKTEVII